MDRMEGEPVRSAPTMLPYAVTDNFLDPTVAEAILEFAIANEPRFRSATMIRADGEYVDDTYRKSSEFAGSSSDWAGPFKDAITERLDTICEAIGVASFTPSSLELSLVASRDGAFYVPHIDLITGKNHRQVDGDRVVSCVLYLHRQPAGFSGGELDLMMIGSDAPGTKIAPTHNRLVAFSSFAPHAVRKVEVPGDSWENARFSVNCWINRARN